MGQISALEGGLKQVPNADVKSDAYRRVNGQLLQKIVGSAQSLAKRFPDTQAAKKAASIIERYR